jgi:uncharacterized protein
MPDPGRITNRRDILLLLLYSPGVFNQVNEPIVGRTRLVKMLFLFKKEVLVKFAAGADFGKKQFYEFYPWDFGPFSRDVYDDLSFFQLWGFIQSESADEESLPESMAEWDKWREETEIENDFSVFEEQRFTLTEKGAAFAEKMFDRLSDSQKKLLKMFKARMVKASLRGILRYVYKAYPEQTTASTIKDQVMS